MDKKILEQKILAYDKETEGKILIRKIAEKFDCNLSFICEVLIKNGRGRRKRKITTINIRM